MRHNMRTPMIISGKAVAVRPESVRAPLYSTKNRLVVPLSIKAEGVDKDARTFEGLAAVWDLDLGGDVIHKGAFKNTLKEWKASGEALPLLNSHDHWNIMSALGQLIEAKETDDGLWTKWEVIDGPEGDAVLARLRPSARTKRAIVGKMSIGYEPVEFSFEQPKENPRFDRIRHLKVVNLREVSLVVFPMAPGAAIDASSVKSFLAATQEVKSEELTPETKQELRRLATRIGHLLSAQKKAEGDPAPADTPPVPAPAADESESTGDDSETPPAADDTSDSSESSSDESGTPPASTDGTGDEEAPSGDSENAGGQDGEQKDGTYLYSEALQQRLQKLSLKGKVAATLQSNK